ncbi:hypothetical protein [Streptomyces sp. bgisy153]|uniref:hypothetical protein n=1 Tax=Streptomyces sp. bgisy153 TaxID=3413793 RepID=UPI003D722BB1
MTHAFDLSPAQHAWWAARDAYRISTTALLREALPALGLLGGDDNPYGILRCSLPALPDSAPGQVRIEVNGDVSKIVIEGLPVTVMREVLVPRAGVYFRPFTVETSLGRAASEGRFTERAHGAPQSLTVRSEAVADATLTLPMLIAARALRPVANYLRSGRGK